MMNATIQLLIDSVRLAIHPSLAEPGPLPEGNLGSDLRGFRSWNASCYTRLEIPLNLSGCGHRWIDYDTHDEAAAALDRARYACQEAASPEQALAAIHRFFDAE